MDATARPPRFSTVTVTCPDAPASASAGRSVPTTVTARFAGAGVPSIQLRRKAAFSRSIRGPPFVRLDDQVTTPATVSAPPEPVSHRALPLWPNHTSKGPAKKRLRASKSSMKPPVAHMALEESRSPG